MGHPIIRPVIMCGGSGTRLWPVSREAFPKQFAPIVGEHSTFQQTVQRVADPAIFGKPLIVTNAAHRAMVERQLAEISAEADILLEPMARDSGPAMLASALYLGEHSPDALALMLAADHLVLKPEAFRQAVVDGRAAAAAGSIVTFGILPTSPATGYGYIEPGEVLDAKVRRIARFVEKPDAARAISYIAAGFYWNSGNFLFSPAHVVAEYAANEPESVDLVREAIARAKSDQGVPTLDPETFGRVKKIAFDFAVMEKTRHAAVVAGDFGWSDIGGWDALWEIGTKDEAGNVAKGDVLFIDTQDSFVSSENQLVATIGVKDLVIVATRDAVLVADRGQVAKVKALVDLLKKNGRIEALRNA